MEELSSLWCYEEGIDELRQKLQFATFELESLKMEANEEIRKRKEEVKHLLCLLKVAYQERDEAMDQLHRLLNKLMPTSSPELTPILPHVQPESPLVIPAKGNSSITESNSLSQSHGSSPVDSFFDAVSSPDFSNINAADSCQMGFVNRPFVQDYNCSVSKGLVSPMVNIDPGSAAIDHLVKGKSLPQKGKLLQAVMEAGPLLQTLLVAGPLPRWRNPPPLQPFKIPPVSIRTGTGTANINQKQALNSNSSVQRPLNCSSYLEMSRVSAQMCSASMLNFANSPISGLTSGQLLSSVPAANTQIPTGKRQRFQ